MIAAADPALPLPPRLSNAPTGSQFYEYIKTMTVVARERAILDEIAAGNVPSFLRQYKPVSATVGANKITYYVLPDYMAVGTDADFFRLPMSAPLAQQVADLCESNLPTRKIVNDIYSSAQVKLAPKTFTPDSTMVTVPVFWASHQAIENQRIAAGGVLGQIVGGVKKDIVVTPRLATTTISGGGLPVAIYGWHQLNGNPIQPLYLGHGNMYMDYSHGVRLVKSEVQVNGQSSTVKNVLESSTYWSLLSDEGGPFTSHRYPVGHSQVADWRTMEAR